MERLTNTGTNGEIWITDNDETRKIGQKEAAYKKLKDYEDSEEQGRLIKLPCKIGDELYYPDSYYGVVVSVRLNELIIRFIGINTYSYQYNCCSFDECGDVYEEYEFDNNDFGKTVFLAKAEAEKKLKEMENKNDEKTM